MPFVHLVSCHKTNNSIDRTFTDAREVFMERDEDEASPTACSRSSAEDVFAMTADVKNAKRLVSAMPSKLHP